MNARGIIGISVLIILLKFISIARTQKKAMRIIIVLAIPVDRMIFLLVFTDDDRGTRTTTRAVRLLDTNIIDAKYHGILFVVDVLYAADLLPDRIIIRLVNTIIMITASRTFFRRVYVLLVFAIQEGRDIVIIITML